MDPLYFREGSEFINWLEINHSHVKELWIGFLKKQKGQTPGFTYSEAVEIALCYGWIDGLTQKVDERCFKVRFTPRKPGSNWSRINLNRVEALLSAGLMHESGIEIYEKRKTEFRKIIPETSEQITLPIAIEDQLHENTKAWNYWLNETPYYRRTCSRWINSAKQEITRLRRAEVLINCSEQGMKIPLLRTY